MRIGGLMKKGKRESDERAEKMEEGRRRLNSIWRDEE